MATQAKNEEINNNVGFSNPNGPVRSAIDPLMAAGRGAYENIAPIVAAHPVATGIAASYVPGLNQLPIIRDIKNTRELAQQVINKGANAAKTAMGVNTTTPQTTGPITPNQNYTPSGNPTQQVPIGGEAPPVASSGPPEAPTMPRTASMPAAAAEAVDHNGIISKIAELYKTYGPALADHLTAAGKAISETGAGRALGTVARIAGSTPALGLQLATHSGELNKNEDQALAAVHSAQNQAQWKQYYEMKQRANPNLPNAFSSGFAQQLTSGTTQPQTKTGSVFDKTQ